MFYLERFPAFLLAWSVQALAIVVVAAAVARLIRGPRARLYLWQTVLAMVVLLALVQPLLPLALGDVRVRYLWAVLAAGAVIRLAWIGAGLRRMRHIRRTSSPLRNLPDSRPGIRWYASKRVPAAIVFGWRRPWILLPSGILHLPALHQEAIVRHLVLHVARGDWLMVLGEEIVRSLFWFHPAIWFAIGQIQKAREQAVDQEAERESGTPAALRTYLPSSRRERWYRLSTGQTCF